MDINKTIEKKVAAAEAWIIEHRRDIHRHPEASAKEYRTSKKVKEILEELGLEVKTGYYNTGVVGIIRGAKEGKTLALRFDMDALEMDEETGLPFASENEGIMHACGHDGHTAMGLGIAKVLVELKAQIKGNVKLIFQPAEEDAQTGGGAQYMIKDGVLTDDPKVDAVAAMHIWPKLDFGTIGTKKGTMMAASDPVTIEIIGQGAHASMPNYAVDPIVIGSQIINNIQTIVSRNIDPFEQAVVTFGIFNGGTRYNTIPEKVILEGTVRTFKEEVRAKVYQRIHKIAKNTAEAMGGKVKVDYKKSYPATVNADQMVDFAQKSIEDILGKDSFVEVERPASGGEDFAYFAREVPAVYIWLGYNKVGEDIYPAHSPHFTFDERILAIGVKAFCKMALNWGEQNE